MRAEPDGISAAFASLVALPAEVAGVKGLLAELIGEVKSLRKQLPPTMGTKADAARIFGVSMSSVDRMIADGRLPVTRVGRSVRVDLSQLRPATTDEIADLAAKARGA